MGEQRIGELRPCAAEDFHVGALAAGDQRADRAALVAVEFAGDQRLHQQGVVLEGLHFQIEAFGLGEPSLGCHVDKASIALWHEGPVAPKVFGVKRRCGYESERDRCEDAANAHTDTFMRAVQSSRRRSRNTLPRSLLGSSATMKICFGIFAGGKNASQWRLTEASVRPMPGLATT